MVFQNVPFSPLNENIHKSPKPNHDSRIPVATAGEGSSTVRAVCDVHEGRGAAGVLWIEYFKETGRINRKRTQGECNGLRGSSGQETES